MKNPKLEALVKQFETLSQVLKSDDDGNYNLRAAREMQKRQATAQLPDLRQDYARELAKTVIKLFVNANQANSKQVASLLKDEKVAVVMVENIYDRLFDSVKRQIGNLNVVGVSASIALREECADIAKDLGVMSIKDFDHNQVSFTNDLELHNLVKKSVRSVFGDELNKAFITSQLVNKTLDARHSDDVVFLLVPSVNKDEQATLTSLFEGRPSFSLEINDNEKPAKTTATKILNKVSEFFKAQKEELKQTNTNNVK